MANGSNKPTPAEQRTLAAFIAMTRETGKPGTVRGTGRRAGISKTAAANQVNALIDKGRLRWNERGELEAVDGSA
jgi:hypothetical protein